MITEYAAEQNYTEETAAEYLTIAKQGRSRAPFYSTIHDDDRPGKIRINVRENEADILKFTDGDDWNTFVLAKVAIRQILKISMRELPKKLTIPFELEQEKMWYGS